MNRPEVRLRPIVSWPREVEAGRSYLVTVDVDLDGEHWPYDREEYAVGCMIDGPPELRIESVGDSTVVVHRFGGTYGPARFVAHALEAPARNEDWELQLTLLTAGGVPFRSVPLPMRGPTDAGDAVPALPVAETWIATGSPDAPAPRATPSTGGSESSAPLDDLDPRMPLFYLSYADSGRGTGSSNATVLRFFDDLSADLAELVSQPPGAEPGFTGRPIGSGSRWAEELLTAVGNCQVFVALLSPSYVRSELCGMEWDAFARREVVSRRPSAPAQTAIIPVLWAPVREEEYPAAVQRVQRFSPPDLHDPRMTGGYEREGLYGLLQLGATQQYQTVVWRLAQQIAGLCADYRVRPRTIEVSELRDAFQAGNT